MPRSDRCEKRLARMVNILLSWNRWGMKSPERPYPTADDGGWEHKRSPARMPGFFARSATKWCRSGETYPEKKREPRLAPGLSLEDTGGDPLFLVRYEKSKRIVERVSRVTCAQDTRNRPRGPACRRWGRSTSEETR
jgi:hypothetical protein